MYVLNHLSKDDYYQAIEQNIVLNSIDKNYDQQHIHGEYVAELVRNLLFEIYQEEIYSNDINVLLEYTRKSQYTDPEGLISLKNNIEKDLKEFTQILN